jgi:uncharacterized protein YcbK (DUF882 family)
LRTAETASSFTHRSENGMTVRRRDFLFDACTAIAGVTAFGHPSWARASQTSSLVFYHIHTAEKLNVVYREHGEIVAGAVNAINYYLRDFRTGQEHTIDVALLDGLSALYEQFDRRGNFEVISGYRSPRTNAALRHVTTGVAKDSLHMFGQAIDVRLTSAATLDLRDAAIALQRGGVGYYPESNFVHIDTGPVRRW